MEGKRYILVAYALIGLAIALWPILSKESVSVANFQSGRLERLSSGWLWRSSCFAIAILGVLLISGKSITTLVLSFALIAFMLSLATKKFDMLATLTTFLALCVSVTILWWRRGSAFNFSSLELAFLCTFTFLFIHLFRVEASISTKENGFSIKWLIPYILLASLLSFSTGIFYNNLLIMTLWQHWGAYIGPAELLLAGAAIFHDFPTQYGLGPTSLIASFCGNDCWQGMYFITAFTTLIFSVLIATLALALSRKYWLERLAVLTLSLVTCFFWAAYPPFAGSPIQTPSATGLRFLPAVILLTYLFFTKQIECSKIKIAIAHSLWVLGTLWSPESAFYVTFMWWPYYIFVKRGQGKIQSRFKGLIKAALQLLTMIAGLVIIFNIIFRVIYHKGPTLFGFLAYALNPPGPLPISTHGGIWYFFSVMTIGVITLIHLWRQSGDTLLFRCGFLLILLNYSVFSYFLGRSHDNTFLNISPFMLLVLLHAIAANDNKKSTLRNMSVICSMALLGWLPTGGWSAWHDNLNNGRLFSFNPKIFREFISFYNPLTHSKVTDPFASSNINPGFSKDAWQAINFLQQHYREPATVLNPAFSMIGSASPAVWSAIHGFSNYVFIPSQHRRMFLRATATSLNRSGWLIIERNFPAEEYLADFDFVYQRTNRLEFGSYYAIRFSPKMHG